MKTTVYIPDTILDEARRIAARERTTVTALIEEGLRRVIAERNQRKKFRLRKATFKGDGLQPQVADSSWEKIREISYEGRGG
jgi:hypothetical protein